ncbi:hypothetical protein F4779DRAFT_481771 [Xylariaceae sp. FL0662B]|nr:hypothetical protein F4779DRAFT_481771 [Xylariaceae sp. FL0662B]
MEADTPLLGHDVGREEQHQGFVEDWRSKCHQVRTKSKQFMDSRTKYWVILILIILDIAGILADIFIALVTCELGIRYDGWVTLMRGALANFSLGLSCIFMVELTLSLFADGLEYLRSWFHCFDAFVIVVSFAIDLLEHNTVEQIASLVVILRLWRFVKIVNEFSVEASEQTESLRKRVELLESRNAALEARLSRR